MSYPYYWNGIYFPSQEAMDAYIVQYTADQAALVAQRTAEEVFRQNAVVVKQAANQNLRDQIDELLSGASRNPNELEFLVILESGELTFFGNRGTAQDWGGSQNKAFALCEIRSVQITDLSEAAIAARVAAL